MRIASLILFIALSFFSFGQEVDEIANKRVIPVKEYDNQNTPLKPDYSNLANWASHPAKEDFGDRTPRGLSNGQEESIADVFFIHPTTYTGKKGEDQWNGPVNDEKLNKKTDKSTIKYQSTAFNLAGRIFAPRYRQAHIYCYFTDQSDNASRAFDLAYSDVKRAFENYLANYNEGRPIIIASHSQGSTHGIRLMKEFFDGKDLMDQLVAAYLIGMPVAKKEFENIQPCESSEETGCYISWRTYARGYYPPWGSPDESHILATNPLTWTTDETYADYELNEGGVLRKFKKVRKGVVDAQIYKGFLWINNLKVFGARLVKMKNYHVADINLFYMNIRLNAHEKVLAFTKMAELVEPGSGNNNKK